MTGRSSATSGSAAVTSTSAASTIRSRSASGTPIMSEIVTSGRRLATSWTKSPPPLGVACSTIVFALARMPSSIRLTWRGVNAEETRPRSLVWRGASVERKDCEASSISGGASPKSTPLPEQNVFSGGSVCIIVGGDGYSTPISKVRMPLPEQNVFGSREIARMSS